MKETETVTNAKLTIYANPRERRWVYVPHPGRGYWTMTAREYEAKPRCYVWIMNEGILSNLENRMRRPVDLYRKFLPAVKAAMFLTEEQAAKVKFNWSQKAGCSCGCSPAFIVSGLPGGAYFDINVLVEDAAPELVADESKPKRIINDPTLPFASEEAYA